MEITKEERREEERMRIRPKWKEEWEKGGRNAKAGAGRLKE